LSKPLEERACELAVYIIETGATVRAAAKHYHISKSTVHKDISQRLEHYNPTLYAQVRQILQDSGKVRKVLQGHYHPGHCSVHQGIEYRTFPALCEQGAAWEILTAQGKGRQSRSDCRP